MRDKSLSQSSLLATIRGHVLFTHLHSSVHFDDVDSWSHKSHHFQPALGQSSSRTFLPPFRRPTSGSSGHAAGCQEHFISGYKIFKAEKVLNIFLHTTSASETIIKADVEASMSLAKRYPVHAVLCQDGQVTKASCACKAGKGGGCKHVTALLWHMLDLVREGRSFIPDALACTEGARQWGPSSSRSASTTLLKELDFVKHDPNKKSRGATKTAQVHVDVTQAALKRLHADFVENGIFPMFADVIEDAAFTALPRKVQEHPALDDTACVASISLPVKECDPPDATA
ncbi:hypothetical protein HPB47_022178 [Ixodes persulcatus]|uniref:Uncharacterized protein n=1 Tax=Ixodes persulcatus TaxID=34615 RepID=A0AC60QAF1_IXOPE|nr:hypothetical protein HPB47_022178 [Ixodes persulcatus]